MLKDSCQLFCVGLHPLSQQVVYYGYLVVCYRYLVGCQVYAVSPLCLQLWGGLVGWGGGPFDINQYVSLNLCGLFSFMNKGNGANILDLHPIGRFTENELELDRLRGVPIVGWS